MGPVCIEGESMSDAGWEAKFKECQVYSGPPMALQLHAHPKDGAVSCRVRPALDIVEPAVTA